MKDCQAKVKIEESGHFSQARRTTGSNSQYTRCFNCCQKGHYFSNYPQKLSSVWREGSITTLHGGEGALSHLQTRISQTGLLEGHDVNDIWIQVPGVWLRSNLVPDVKLLEEEEVAIERANGVTVTHVNIC